MREIEKEGGRKVNRSKKEGASVRRIRKVLGKTNWYKNTGRFSEEKKAGRKAGPPVIKQIRNCSKKKSEENKTKPTEAVLFVPCTPGGLLQKYIQETEDRRKNRRTRGN